MFLKAITTGQNPNFVDNASSICALWKSTETIEEKQLTLLIGKGQTYKFDLRSPRRNKKYKNKLT